VSALVGVDVAVAVVGLAVLAAFTVRLWGQVKMFGRSVTTASGQLQKAQEALSGLERRTSGTPAATYTRPGSTPSEGARRG
jgi:hypothetical protein